MSLLVYAITDVDQVSGTGIADTPLSLVRSSGVGAVVTHHPSVQTSDGEQRMWEYERVVETLMESGAVLPARYGTTLEHEAAARAFLDLNREQLRRALVRVRGAVEMGVRAQWSDGFDGPLPASGQSGAGYMLCRLASLRAAQRIADQLGPLTAVARRARLSLLPRRSVALLAAYLVEQSQAEEFAEECGRLNSEIAQAELTCTGPWPPYSFTRGDDAG